MFATMLAADPPIRYWLPETLLLLAAVEALREQGVAAWETMDAGPQVKVLCLDRDAQRVTAALAAACPDTPPPIVSAVGAGVSRGG
jgi:diphosphomevalonate decarboxylase